MNIVTLRTNTSTMKCLNCIHKPISITYFHNLFQVRLMEGMPHAVVLENDLEEMFILLAATAMPVRPVVPGSIFATKVRDSKPNQTTMLVYH